MNYLNLAVLFMLLLSMSVYASDSHSPKKDADMERRDEDPSTLQGLKKPKSGDDQADEDPFQLGEFQNEPLTMFGDDGLFPDFVDAHSNKRYRDGDFGGDGLFPDFVDANSNKRYRDVEQDIDAFGAEVDEFLESERQEKAGIEVLRDELESHVRGWAAQKSAQRRRALERANATVGLDPVPGQPEQVGNEPDDFLEQRCHALRQIQYDQMLKIQEHIVHLGRDGDLLKHMLVALLPEQVDSFVVTLNEMTPAQLCEAIQKVNACLRGRLGCPKTDTVVKLNRIGACLIKHVDNNLDGLSDALSMMTGQMLELFLDVEHLLTRDQMDVMIPVLHDQQPTNIVHTDLYRAKLQKKINYFKTQLLRASKECVAQVLEFLRPLTIEARKKKIAPIQFSIISTLLILPAEQSARVQSTLAVMLQNEPALVGNLAELITILSRFGEGEYAELSQILMEVCTRRVQSQEHESGVIQLPCNSNLIKQLASIISIKVPVVLRAAKAFVLHKMQGDNQAEYLTNLQHVTSAVAEIWPASINKVMTAVETLFEDLDDVWHKLNFHRPSMTGRLIIGLARIPLEHIPAVGKALSEILQDAASRLGTKGSMDAESDEDDVVVHDRVEVRPLDVIGILGKVPLDRLDECVAYAKTIVAGTSWSDEDCAEFVKTLSHMPPERRSDVVKASDQIGKNRTEWSAARHLFAVRALALVSEDRYDEIVGYCHDIMDTEAFDEIAGCGRDLMDTETYEGLVEHVLAGVPYVPAYQAKVFRKAARESYEADDAPSIETVLVRHALVMGMADEQKLQALFAHWKSLMNHEYRERADYVCEFIVNHFIELGLDDEHELVQFAIRVQTVVNGDDPKGPYMIYDQLKKKRLIPVDWGKMKVIEGGHKGLFVRLNHQGLATFGTSMVMDLSSVPPFGVDEFRRLVIELEGVLQHQRQTLTPQMRNTLMSDLDDEAMSKLPMLVQAALMMREPEEVVLVSEGKGPQETVEQVLNRLGMPFLEVLQEAILPTAHMSVLLNAPGTSLETAKLKCALRYLSQIQDETYRNQRLCQFFAAVRNCGRGQDTAINDYYLGLPNRFQIQAKTGVLADNLDSDSLPAMMALYNAMQKVVSMQFSADSVFMKQICGVQPHENIVEAVHQIFYMKGLIGDRVGLCGGPRFDVNANVIYQRILDLSLQQMLELYYEHVELGQVVTLVHGVLNQLIMAETDRGPESLMRSGLAHVYETMKVNRMLRADECYDTWVSFSFKNEDDMDGQLDHITERGVMRLMQHGGILDEVDAALPW
jgi:hypothetical protein